MHPFAFSFSCIALVLVELYVFYARGTLCVLCRGTLLSLLYEMVKLLYAMVFGIRIYLVETS